MKSDYGLNSKVIAAIGKALSHYPNVDEAILYGSRAMGTYRRGSDIDLTLNGENISLEQCYQLENKLGDLLLPYKFDISIMSQISNSDLIDHTNRVGKVFYSKAGAAPHLK